MECIVDIYADDEIFTLVIFDDIAAFLLHVQHIGAVHDHIVKAGIVILVQAVNGI